MSETVVALAVTFLILGALAVWVPMLHFCDGCVSRLSRRRAAVLVEEPEQCAEERLADVA